MTEHILNIEPTPERFEGSEDAVNALGDMRFASFVAAGLLQQGGEDEAFPSLCFEVADFWSDDETDALITADHVTKLTLVFPEDTFNAFVAALVGGLV